MLDSKKIEKEIKNLDKSDLKNALVEEMNKIINELKAKNCADMQNLNDAIVAINEALVGEKQREIYAMIDTIDKLQRSIEAKGDEIKATLKTSFEAAEMVVQASDLEQKEYYLNLINNAIIRETRLFDILREITQNAFLNALENGNNVLQTITEIAKNIAFRAINDGDFSSERILEIAKIITNVACELANENHAYAKDLVSGAIFGVKDGVSNAIEILKNDAKFAPSQSEITKSIKELKNIDEGFIDMLKELGAQCIEPSRSIIENLLDNTFDNAMARLRRMSELASANLLERLEEIKNVGNVNAIISAANKRIEQIKFGISETNLSEKFNEFKGELTEIEKKGNKKLEEVKNADIAKEAKKLGERSFNAAKNFIESLKDKK
ncbi:MAG: hypothetical protein K5978_01565 [Campylobacter sp.]|nr:hypothetical protein [Campylobacter sp.]